MSKLQPLVSPPSPPSASWVESMRSYFDRYLLGEQHEQTRTFDAFERDVVDRGWVDGTFTGFLLWNDYLGLGTNDRQWLPYPDVLGAVMARATAQRVLSGENLEDRVAATHLGIRDRARSDGWPLDVIEAVIQHYDAELARAYGLTATPVPAFNPPATTPPVATRVSKLGDNAVVKQSPTYPNQWLLWVRQVYRFSDGTQGYDSGLGWFVAGNVLKTDLDPANFLSVVNWTELSAQEQAEISRGVTGTGGQASIPDTTVNGVPISQVPIETFHPAPPVPEVLRPGESAPPVTTSSAPMVDRPALSIGGSGATKKESAVGSGNGKTALGAIAILVLLLLVVLWANRR